MLAIASGKGGTGKTTTTLGLAAAIDGPVVAVDLDADMPNLHEMAGDEATPSETAAFDALLETETSQSTTLLSVPPDASETSLDAWLTRLSTVEAQVLVDCPAGAGPDVAVALRAADGVLVVSTLCRPALRDTAKTVAMARTLGTSVIGAVLTRSALEPAAVETLFGCPVLGSVPEVRRPVLDRQRVKRSYGRIARRMPTGKN
ncbi:MAG: MinD/ParA family ATP-binding protein [Halobacteriota archaeon]